MPLDAVYARVNGPMHLGVQCSSLWTALEPGGAVPLLYSDPGI